MSTPSPTQIPPFVVPILNEYAKAIKPAVAFQMVGTVFASMLVPLLLSLLYFSTKEQRRTPMFLLVVFDVLLGIALGIWNGYIMVHTLLSPLDASSTKKHISFVTLFLLSPWIVDIVLLVRLLAVFPPLSTPRTKFVAVFAFPTLIKIARLVLVILLAVQWARASHNILQNNFSVGQSQSWARLPYYKVEWICQILDNLYVSAFFLWKLRDSAFNSGTAAGSASSGPSSLGRRLKALFWIAATNFVFPVLFDIAQLIVFYHYPYFTSAYVTVASIYVSIIGVVFATVWASSSVRPARPFNGASLGSVPRSSGNPYALKSGLNLHNLESASPCTPPGGGYAGPYGAREKGAKWHPENGRGPVQTDIPLGIRITQTQEREVL